MAIYYDDGLDAYKREPILTLPDMPNGELRIPKNGSYKIGTVEKSTYPNHNSEYDGRPCWKMRIRITGGQQTYPRAEEGFFNWYGATIKLPENALYTEVKKDCCKYKFPRNASSTSTVEAIKNGEIIIPESE